MVSWNTLHVYTLCLLIWVITSTSTDGLVGYDAALTRLRSWVQFSLGVFLPSSTFVKHAHDHHFLVTIHGIDERHHHKQSMACKETSGWVGSCNVQSWVLFLCGEEVENVAETDWLDSNLPFPLSFYENMNGWFPFELEVWIYINLVDCYVLPAVAWPVSDLCSWYNSKEMLLGRTFSTYWKCYMPTKNL